MAPRRFVLVMTLALPAAAAACEAVAPSQGPDVVRGAIYTEMQGGPPCEPASAPRELAGIRLTFSDGSGAVLGGAITSTLVAEKLGPAGAGAAGDAPCRYASLYEVALPSRPAYTVDFDVPEPPARGGYFSGTDELTSETISREALESAGFTWSFEVPASYVVP